MYTLSNFLLNKLSGAKVISIPIVQESISKEYY